MRSVWELRLILPVLNGRRCVPVRLLPFLTDWDLLPPDVVAQLFASDRQHAFLGFGLVSFNLHEDLSFTEVLASSWVDHLLDLEELSQRLGESGQGHEVWRARAVKLLPAGVFVWLDDLLAALERRNRLSTRLSGHEASPQAELNLQPLIPHADRGIVLEGFECIAFEAGNSRRPEESHLNETPAVNTSNAGLSDFGRPLQSVTAVTSKSLARPVEKLSTSGQAPTTPRQGTAATDNGTPTSRRIEKRAELLLWFRELGGARPKEVGKKGKRGALAELERQTEIDDKNLAQMLDKAIDDERSAAAWKALSKR